MPPVNSPTSPPPKTRSTTRITVPKIDPEKVQNEREQAVAGLFQIASAICLATGQLHDAGAINIHGPAIAHETAALATRYEKVGAVLDGLAQVGPFTAILAATMPLVIQLAANHNRIAPEKAVAFGGKHPSILEGQMRMELRRQQMEYERQVRDEKAMMADFEKAMEEEKVAA